MEGQVDWAKTNTTNTADDGERAAPEGCDAREERAWLEHHGLNIKQEILNIIHESH